MTGFRGASASEGSDMRFFIDTALWWLALAGVLVLAGAVAGRMGWVSARRPLRRTFLVATLLTALELLITQRLGLIQGNTAIDLAGWIGVLWFHSFFMLWAGVSWGLRSRIRAGKSPSAFSESSMLSMQYMDSHEDPNPEDLHWQATQLWPASSGGSATAVVEGSTVASDGTRIPIVRH